MTPSLPVNNAIAIKRTSGLTGRSARGRIYWGNLAESHVTGNLVQESVADAIVDFCNAVDAVAFALDWVAVIVSRTTAGAVRPTGVTFPVTQWSYSDLRVDSRRDRLP